MNARRKVALLTLVIELPVGLLPLLPLLQHQMMMMMASPLLPFLACLCAHFYISPILPELDPRPWDRQPMLQDLRPRR